MGKCLGCKKKLRFFEGYQDGFGEYCKNCYSNRGKISEKIRTAKINRKKMETAEEPSSKKTTKEPSSKEIKEYKRHIKAGLGEWLLTQGGKVGIIFAGFMFFIDYLGATGSEVQSAGFYLVLGILAGLIIGFLGWHNMNKAVEGKKK